MRVTLPLPTEAFAADTQFRWRGQENCQGCQLLLDDGKCLIVQILFLYECCSVH